MQYIHIGFTGKAHGLDGRLKLSPLAAYQDDFGDLEVLFIEENEQYIPYFVQHLNLKSVPPLVTLEDIDSRENAARLANKKVWARSTDLPEAIEKTTLLYHKYIGYTLIDEHHGELGKIEDVQQFPHQEMAFFNYNNADKLIPLNDSLITRVDKEKQTIHLNLPEGLLEI